MFVSGSGMHNVSSCQALCLTERGCAYIAHSELYGRCFLCSTCNKQRPRLRGGGYSAWARLGPIDPPQSGRHTGSLGAFGSDSVQRRIQLLLDRMSGSTIFFIGDSQLRYLFLYLARVALGVPRDKPIASVSVAGGSCDTAAMQCTRSRCERDLNMTASECSATVRASRTAAMQRQSALRALRSHPRVRLFDAHDMTRGRCDAI